MQKEYLILFSVLANFLIGLLLILKEKNKQIKIHFLLFTLAITSWSFSLYFYHNQNLLNYPAWIKIITSLTIISVFELLCLIIAVSKRRLKEFTSLLIAFLILSILIILSFFINSKTLELLLSPPFITFFILLFTYSAWIAIILFERTLKNSNIEHLQAISILLSFGLFTTAITILDVFMPLILKLTNYSWLNPIFSSFLIGFIAFIISPYYFLKIKNIRLEFLVGIIGIILLILPLLMQNLSLKILTTAVFLLFCLLGYHLIKIISKESRQKEEAEKLAAEWKKLNFSKDQFILSFQHHLRTPLVPIKGYLEMILKGDYGREENPLIREKLIEIRERVDILYSLIEGLLDVQEVRVGKKILNLENYQINNLIESVLEELKIEAEKKGLYLRFKKIPLPEIKIIRIKLGRLFGI